MCSNSKYYLSVLIIHTYQQLTLQFPVFVIGGHDDHWFLFLIQGKRLLDQLFFSLYFLWCVKDCGLFNSWLVLTVASFWTVYMYSIFSLLRIRVINVSWLALFHNVTVYCRDTPLTDFTQVCLSSFLPTEEVCLISAGHNLTWLSATLMGWELGLPICFNLAPLS